MTYCVEMLDTAGLRSLDAGQWDALSAQALDDNPFYDRSFVLAGLGTIERGADLRAVAIFCDDTLVALFPYRLKRWPVQRVVAAGNLYQFSSQPLIHRDHASGAIAAWLDAIDRSVIPRRWRFVDIGLNSGFLRQCQQSGGGRLAELVPSRQYARAGLTRLDGGFEAHLNAAVSRSRIKDIQRSIRRLGEVGPLAFERARTPELVAQRLEDFLVLEHSGWKGRAGTSLLSDGEHAAFARQAFARTGSARSSVDSLLLDGRPIAISVNLQTGGTMFTPKCAYDEALRKFCPGLVLEYHVIEAFYADADCVEMDAATTVAGHVIEGLWNARKPMGTMLIGPPGKVTRFVAWAQHGRIAAREAIKAAFGTRLRGVVAMTRNWQRRMQVVRHNIMVGGVSLIQAVETVVPVLAV